VFKHLQHVFIAFGSVIRPTTPPPPTPEGQGAFHTEPPDPFVPTPRVDTVSVRVIDPDNPFDGKEPLVLHVLHTEVDGTPISYKYVRNIIVFKCICLFLSVPCNLSLLYEGCCGCVRSCLESFCLTQLGSQTQIAPRAK